MNMRKTNKNVGAGTFNQLLENCEKYNINHELKIYSTSVQLETNSHIYRCSLTGRDEDIVNVGVISSTFFNKELEPFDIRGKYGYREIEDAMEDKKIIQWDYKIAAGFQYCDEDFTLQNLKCWSYDINSAFSYAMLSPMPDTRAEPRYNDKIRSGEIGFME